MRLLNVICSTEAESGGPIEAVRQISEVLIRCGHTSDILSLDTHRTMSTPVDRLQLIRLGRGLGRYRLNPALPRWVRAKAIQYDTVILHGLWNFSSVGAWWGLRQGSVPYFVFAHGMLDSWFRSQYPIKHLVKQFYWTVLEGRVLEGARRVLFTCEEEQRRALGAFRGHPYRAQIIHLGTADPWDDSKRQCEAFLTAFPITRDRDFLLFLSRIHPKKGCDLLLDAFADTVQQLPANLDLVIAGPDQMGWVSRLQARARQLQIAHRVHWTGMLTGDAKWGAFHAAKAMILPSHQENFGFVVVEAMACFTPVLISDKVNIWREVVAAGAGIVEPDTLEGTRNLLLRYAQLSPEDLVAMGQGARSGFLRNFDIEVTARAFANTIRTLKDEDAGDGPRIPEKHPGKIGEPTSH